MAWSYTYNEDKKQGVIRMNRGDTPTLSLSVMMQDAETGQSYEYAPDLENGDSVIFAVKQNKDDFGNLFYIHCQNDMTVRFKSTDTRNLPETTNKFFWELSVNIPSSDPNVPNFHCTYLSGILILDMEIYYDLDTGSEE